MTQTERRTRRSGLLVPDGHSVTGLLTTQLPRGVLAAISAIEPGDDRHLTTVEIASLASTAPSVRAASGAARRVARSLCRRVSMDVRDIPRSRRGSPVWPVELVGSLAHDAIFAAAVVAQSEEFGGVGIDVEVPERLDTIVSRLIATDDEQRQFAEIPFGDKALFSIKEAVFKSLDPTDRHFLDFHEVEVNVQRRTATTAQRVVNWCVLTEPWVVAVAWWSRSALISESPTTQSCRP